MIDKQAGLYIPICDICGQELEGHSNFNDAVASQKAAGWILDREYDDWFDICNACQELE